MVLILRINCYMALDMNVFGKIILAKFVLHVSDDQIFSFDGEFFHYGHYRGLLYQVQHTRTAEQNICYPSALVTFCTCCLIGVSTMQRCAGRKRERDTIQSRPYLPKVQSTPMIDLGSLQNQLLADGAVNQKSGQLVRCLVIDLYSKCLTRSTVYMGKVPCTVQFPDNVNQWK